jgi:hypothetical protein
MDRRNAAVPAAEQAASRRRGSETLPARTPAFRCEAGRFRSGPRCLP